MARYNHAYEIAFSLESSHEDGDDVTPQMLRTALLRRMDDLDIAGEWEEAVGAPFDTYEVDESDRPPAFFRVTVWDSATNSATWYFDSLERVSKATEIAYAHGATQSEVRQVRCYPKGGLAHQDEVLDWIKRK